MADSDGAVVWFFDDEIADMSPYIEEIERYDGVHVMDRATADEAMETFDLLRKGQHVLECDCIVLDMKMGLPQRREHRRRMHQGQLNPRFMGAYLLEDLRRTGSRVPVVVLSAFSVRSNLPSIWEAFIVVNNVRTEAGQYKLMPDQKECEQHLEREFRVAVRQKTSITFSDVVLEIVERARSEYKAVRGGA